MFDSLFYSFLVLSEASEHIGTYLCGIFGTANAHAHPVIVLRAEALAYGF